MPAQDPQVRDLDRRHRDRGGLPRRRRGRLHRDPVPLGVAHVSVRARGHPADGEDEAEALADVAGGAAVSRGGAAAREAQDPQLQGADCKQAAGVAENDPGGHGVLHQISLDRLEEREEDRS